MRYRATVGSVVFDTLNYAFMVLLVLSMIYPFVYMVSVSISDYGEIARNTVKLLPKGPLTIQAYRMLLSTQDIPRSFLNSVMYTVMGVVFTLIISSMTAYVLEQRYLPYRRVLIVFTVLTMFLPGGMIPSFLVIRALKLYNTIWAVTLPGAFGAWNILIMRSTIRSTIAQELLDAAYMDSAGEWRIYFQIVLPLIKPILATIGLFAAVGYWNDFFGPLIYLSDARRYPLTMLLRKILLQDYVEKFYSAYKAEHTGAPNEFLGIGFFTAFKYATMIVAIWPIIVVYPFVQKYFVKGVLIGSIKG
jgi:putative aldouronate transport system permease protein